VKGEAAILERKHIRLFYPVNVTVPAGFAGKLPELAWSVNNGTPAF